MDSNAGISYPNFKELSHGLDGYPGELQVYAKARSGVNSGYVFNGIGPAQSDADAPYYGGIAFGFNSSHVLLLFFIYFIFYILYFIFYILYFIFYIL